MWPKLGKFARYFLLGLSTLSILMALNWLYVDIAPMLNSLGETNGADCDTRGDFPSVPNGVGMVVTGHSTGCAVVLLSTAFTTYIYVHKIGESDSAKSLVFRFDESFVLVKRDPLQWGMGDSTRGDVPQESYP